MSKGQLAILSFTGLLFLLLYFGFDTKPKAQKEVERVRTLTAESTDINSLLLTAKKNLKSAEASEIVLAESKLSEANKNGTDKTEAYKALSSAWYKINRFAIAGYYAQQVAEIEATDEAWSIAGATYNRGMNLETEEKVIDYCTNRAKQAFENAISLNSSNVNHKVNLATCYVEDKKNPPMKGVGMLMELNKQHPENLTVLIALGRFGLVSKQFEKASGRLEKALQLAPENIKVNCLLAQAYEGLGQMDKAKTFQDKCESLASAQR